jgi:DNA topoisomerase-1
VRKHLKDEQYKLYKLIWDRFVASQMKDAIFDQTSVEIEAKAPASTYTLRASGRILKFAGWLEVYGTELQTTQPAGAEEAAKEDGEKAEDADAEGTLPADLAESDALDLISPPGVSAEQKFTQPPARYNEGSLVRELEKRGIGRPSTYADIISKVQARDYVEKLPGGQMQATELGKIVVDGLVSTDLEFMDPGFTAKMEEELDEVEAGKLERVDLLKRFYGRFSNTLTKAKKAARWAPAPEPTDFKCSECGAKMLKRWSKNGWFLGCEKYPTCKHTQNLDKEGKGPEKPVLTHYKCDECGKPMAIRNGRYGEYLSCSGYPVCKNTKPVPLGVPCPKCGGDIVEIRAKKRGGKTFYGCANYPQCDFKVWQKPIPEPCPLCAHPFLVEGGGKKNPKILCPRGKDCGYSRSADAPEPAMEGTASGRHSTGAMPPSSSPSLGP